jgi:hypothetical protein
MAKAASFRAFLKVGFSDEMTAASTPAPAINAK